MSDAASIRYCRSRAFDRPEERITEADAHAAPAHYRLIVDGERVLRAEYIQRGTLVRVVYVRVEPLDPALLDSHRTTYGAVAIDIDTPQRREGALRTRTRIQYDADGRQRRFTQTFLDDRGDLVREILGDDAPQTIIEHEHDENHVLLRSTYKRPDGTVIEVYDWFSDRRLGM
jgi:hypothetical protein